ncbi:MAG: VacJ family lipoprotein [Erythrobacter sp.]
MPSLSALILATPMAAAQVPVAVSLPAAPLPTIAASGPPPFIQTNWSLQASQPAVADPLLSQESAEDRSEPETAETPEDDEPIDEIIVTGGYGPPDEDPLMRINETAFDVSDSIDQALVGPVADVYESGLPSPVRLGLRNFSRNLREPTNFVNFLLQGKFGKAFETLGRFTINSTLGLGGLIDIADKPGIDLPYRRNGFSDTMGFYGVGEGPFLVLPLVGATSLRDLIGTGLDQSLVPFAVGKPFNTPEYGVPAYIINSLNVRIDMDQAITENRDSDDPYVFLRDEYLGERRAQIQALKDGADDAGIPGIDRYQRERDGPIVGTDEAAEAVEAPANNDQAATSTNPPMIEADTAVIGATSAEITEDGGRTALRSCTVAAPCRLKGQQFARGSPRMAMLTRW